MKQKSLILMISVALIVVMTLSVVSAWPWSATGKATDSNTIYTIYQGKTQNVEVGENNYKIGVKIVSSLSRALLNIDGIQHEVKLGINQIGNIQIDVLLMVL